MSRDSGELLSDFVSLFAGVGGFDLAFERAGMRCVGQVEKDTHCRKVLDSHWPDVPKWGDIADVSGLPTTDVLVGGFPCQDYSVAGRRGGLAADRGALWWQFHRLIDECRPRWVVGENVPGLLSSNDGRDFRTIIDSLVELGYGVCWRILDAQWFGVAQRRRRPFIVGHSGGIPRPEILFEPEGLSWDSPPLRKEGQRVAALTANGLGGGGPDDNLAQAGHVVAHTLTQGAPSAGRRNEDDYNLVYLPNTVGSLRQTDHKAPKIDIAEPSLIAFNWQATGDWVTPHESYTDALHVGQVPAVAFAQNTRDEVRDLGDLAGALQGQGTKQTTYLARPSVRRLTPLECERLQGFPDNWTAGQSDTQRYRQMGNAVCVPVAEWIGRAVA